MGPTSNSNQFFGIKISQTGTPVNQAADSQLIYKSNFSTNLFNGPGGIWKIMEGTRQPTLGNGLTIPQQGFWVAQDGIDVQQATDAQMIFNSNGSSSVLGYAQITSNFSTSATSATQVTGLTAPITTPIGGRGVKITAFGGTFYNSGTDAASAVTIWDGSVGGGTQLAFARGFQAGGSGTTAMMCIAVVAPAAGLLKTYNVAIHSLAAGTATVEAATTAPAFILVEAV